MYIRYTNNQVINRYIDVHNVHKDQELKIHNAKLLLTSTTNNKFLIKRVTVYGRSHNFIYDSKLKKILQSPVSGIEHILNEDVDIVEILNVYGCKWVFIIDQYIFAHL